jgi:hypothetical protein
MSRPRSRELKIGDKVKHGKKEGVVVFVQQNFVKPYNVHFYPNGRGLFSFDELEKVKPIVKLVDESEEFEILTEE